MAIIVQDTFTRADDPTSLGTADTGQAWSTVSGGTFGIASNMAVRTNATSTSGKAILDSGFTEAKTKVTLVNPEALSSGAGNFGIIFRYADSTHFYGLTYESFPGNIHRLRLKKTQGAGTVTIADFSVTLVAGDTIACGYCGTTFDVYINDVLQGSVTSTSTFGTFCGLTAFGGTLGVGSAVNEWDNFLVETYETCTPTYNCVGGACVDPGDGSGTYPSLAACLAGCVVATSYNCIGGQCVDPGDGSGTFASLAECVDSGCGAVTATVATQRFDAGTGSAYYYVPPVVDSGDELRSKTVKAVRTTGKFTNAAEEVYGYDVSDVISTSDLEDGLNSDTGQLAITDTSGVAQTPREQVNVPNAVLHTVRILGDDTGETERDRIDEIVTEQSSIGVRR